MKHIILILLLLITITFTTSQTTTDQQAQLQEEEMEEQMRRYQFLLKLIQQFDNSGKGSVKKEDYAQFLAKVFVEGNRQEGYEIPDVQYLKRATLAFAESKNQEEIGVQDFYEDLLSKFYQFLSEKEEYHQLVSQLFQIGADEEANKAENHETQQL